MSDCFPLQDLSTDSLVVSKANLNGHLSHIIILGTKRKGEASLLQLHRKAQKSAVHLRKRTAEKIFNGFFALIGKVPGACSAKGFMGD